jgi:hypothetical protein
MQEEFRRLGFKMKILITGDYREISFLKGTFYDATNADIGQHRRADNTFVWAPLPSRILKAGKSLRDPRELYRMSKNDTYLTAVEAFLSDVATGHQAFAAVPLLRAFCTRYSGRVVKERKFFSKKEFWKVQADDGVLDPVMEEFRDMFETWPPSLDNATQVSHMATRYQCPPDWFREVEAMYSDESVCKFLTHPLFRLLAAQDYG